MVSFVFGFRTVTGVPGCLDIRSMKSLVGGVTVTGEARRILHNSCGCRSGNVNDEGGGFYEKEVYRHTKPGKEM